MTARIFDATKLDRDWANAWRRAEGKFVARETRPLLRTHAAAVVLEL